MKLNVGDIVAVEAEGCRFRVKVEDASKGDVIM